MMKTLNALICRNTKLFFKDKGMFFTSLITPAILLVLYGAFLSKVYKDSFISALPNGLPMADELINGCVGGQLISSILAVSCITVAFCSNMLMVQDKANGSIKDIRISPVSGSTLALGYYVSTFFSTLIICLIATAICLGYIAYVGWYMSVLDVILLVVDVMLLVLFGTALSSVVNFFLSTQGQISAVGTIVSSGYGFISGAYMPISQFSPALQKVILFLPGTYGTSLLRNHALRGVFKQMEEENFPKEAIDGIKAVVDCDIKFFDYDVTIPAMYAVLCISIILLIGIYVLMNIIRLKKTKE